jgi:citrate lyase subunit beta/citryl-CoA lyase
MNIRPRRSALYMPGANARALEKAKTLPCDAVILDLEDAVAPDAKVSARDRVMAAVAARGFGAREVIVRVNGLDTAWWRDDLDAAAKAGPDGVLVPKVSKPADLQTVTARLADIAAGNRIWLWAMIETPLAIINAADIAAVARDGEIRLGGFMMGTNDLSKETRARLMDGRAPMVSWLTTAVLAAHAYGIDVLDGVYNDIHDAEGFRRECIQGRDMGFDGKTLVFSPTAEEIHQARRIIAVFELPENHAKGVVQLDGRMVERMHADTARRTVALADGINDAEKACDVKPTPAS